MLESDIIIRTCEPLEASGLNIRNQTEDLIYFMYPDDNFVYHYILVDDSNYRLKYEEVAPRKLKFTGEAVEIDEPKTEFVDDDWEI